MKHFNQNDYMFNYFDNNKCIIEEELIDNSNVKHYALSTK